MADLSDAAHFSEPSDESARSSTPAKRAPAQLVLLPIRPQRSEQAPPYEPSPAPGGPRKSGRWRAAAGAQYHAAQAAKADRAETQALAHRLDTLAARLESLDTKGSRDDLASLRKPLADLKASAHELGGAVAQVGARVDRLDRDATQQFAGVAARLEKLEAKASVAAAPKTDAVRTEPGVAMEPTGSLEKPKPRLRNFYLAEIRNGYALIGGPQGEFAVAPGDSAPGVGRVLRIERHGRDWVVVTTLGQIASADN